MADREFKWWGGVDAKPQGLVETDALLSLRTPEPAKTLQALLSKAWRDKLRGWRPVLALMGQGLILLGTDADRALSRDEVASFLKEQGVKGTREPGVVHADTGAPVLVSRRIHVRFRVDTEPREAEELLRHAGVKAKAERVTSSRRLAYDVETGAKRTEDVFAAVDGLREADSVETAYPHLGLRIRAHAATEDDWTLRRVQWPNDSGWEIVNGHASVAEAWSLTRGRRVTWHNPPWPYCRPWRRLRRVRVAVIDSGIDIDHPEFKGWGKVIHPANLADTPADEDPRPVGGGEAHGTTMAGLAVGNGSYGASGAAPRAALIPIRMWGSVNLPSAAVATDAARRAFEHALASRADVISCSWEITGITSLGVDLSEAITAAATDGRGGRGCVILFAAGDVADNPDIADNLFASRSDVIAVGACDADGAPVASSPSGEPLWCQFPVGTLAHPLQILDSTGASSQSDGDYFSEVFGSTSHACAAAAGAVALILARNHTLTRQEVKNRIADTCDKVDQVNASYSADGWSSTHGYGRINALRAVMGVQPGAF